MNLSKRLPALIKISALETWVSSFLIISYLSLFIFSHIQAQSVPCQGITDYKIDQGLITTPNFDPFSQQNLKSTAGCITQNPAYIDLNSSDVRLSSYGDLYARYFDRATSPKIEVVGLGSIDDGTLYHIAGNLTLAAAPVASVPIGQVSPKAIGIVFVEGDLNITGDVDYADTDPKSGLVLVVKNNVNISPSVTKITAVIISSGTICTNYRSDGTCRSNAPQTPDSPLVVKGNLISLNSSFPPKLVRNLFGSGSTTRNAETIQVDPKYFVLLKDALSQKISFTSENTNFGVNIRPCTTTFSGCNSRCQEEVGTESRICEANTTGARTRACVNPISCLTCAVTANSGSSNNSCSDANGTTGSQTFTINYSHLLGAGHAIGTINGTFSPTLYDDPTKTWDNPTAVSTANNSTTYTYSQYASGNWQAKFVQDDSGVNNGSNTTCISNSFGINAVNGCDATVCRETTTTLPAAQCGSGSYTCAANAGTMHPRDFDSQCSQCNGSGGLNQYWDGTHCTQQTCPFPTDNHTAVCGTASSATVNGQTVQNDSNGCNINTQIANTYFNGSQCTQNSCNPNPQFSCPALDATGCHDPQNGYSGVSCNPNSQTCEANYTTFAGYVGNTFNDKCLACNGSGQPNQYYDGLSCGLKTCPMPYANSTPPGNRLAVCGATTTTTVSGTTYTNDANGCNTTPETLKTFYPGNSCTQGNCNPNPMNFTSCNAIPDDAGSDIAGCYSTTEGYSGTSCDPRAMTCPATYPFFASGNQSSACMSAVADTSGSPTLNKFWTGASCSKSNCTTPASTLSSCPSVCTDIMPQARGYWKFTESGGNYAADISGNNIKGTLTSGPTWTTGKYGNGLSFDGVDDYVDLGTSSAINGVTGDLTIGAWVYITDLSTARAIMTSANNGSTGFAYHFLINTNGAIRFNGNNAGIAEGIDPVPLNTWTHVAMSISGTQLTFYRNGVADSGGVKTLTATPRTEGNGNVTLSRIGTQQFIGKMDEVAIYPNALTSTQINTLMNGGVPGQYYSGSSLTLSTCNNNYHAPDYGGSCNNIPDDSPSTPSCHTARNIYSGTTCGQTTTCPAVGVPVNNFATACSTMAPTVSTLSNYWAMEETAGTPAIADTIGNSVASITGGITAPAGGGGHGKSLTIYNGGYINASVGTYFGADNALSVSAQVYMDSATNGPVVGMTTSPVAWNMPFISVNGANIYGHIWGVNGNVPMSTTATLSNWHTITVTYDPTFNSGQGKECLYVDGVQKTCANGRYAPAGATVYWTTNIPGGKPAGVNSIFSGSFDEVAFYKKALSAAEVLTLHQNGIVKANSYYDGNSCGPLTCPSSNTWSSGSNSLLLKMDEGSGGATTDASGNSNTPTLVNSPSWTAGQYGSALSFNGTSQYLSVPNSSSLSPTSTMTITAWIKLSGGTGTFRHIVVKPSSSAWASPFAVYALRINTNNKLEFWINNNTLISTGNVTLNDDNSWKPVAAVFDGSFVKTYVNGVLDSSTAINATSINTSTQPLAIGTYNTALAPNYLFNGALDDIRIYSRALSDPEILALSKAPVSQPSGDQCAATCSTQPNSFYSGTAGVGKSLCPYPPKINCVGYDATSCHDPVTGASGTSCSGTITCSNNYTTFSGYSTQGAPAVCGANNTNSCSSASMVGYWGFESINGNIALNSAGSVNGTAIGSPVLSVGQYGNGLLFNGSNYINIDGAALPTGSSARTLTAWFKSTSGASPQEIFSYGTGSSGQVFTIGTDNWAGHEIFVSAWASPQYSVPVSGILNGNWHHIAASYTGTNMTIYIDGVSKDSRAFSVNTVTGTARIGARIGNVEGFNGTLDEVTVYNIALSASDVSALYTGDKLKQAYSGTSCTLGSCSYPYASAGNMTAVCGASNATACQDSTTLKKYYPGNTCAQANCGFPADQACPVDNSCHNAYSVNVYNGLSCTPLKTCVYSSTYYPNNSATACSTHGCSLVTGGTRQTYDSGASCTVHNDANCSLVSTQATQCSCPADGKFYHDASSCGTIECAKTAGNYSYYPTNNTTAACQSAIADGSGNPTLGTSYPGNSCSQGACSAPASTLASCTSSCHPMITASLFMKLNESTGNFAADISGYNNKGTLFNAPTWTTGKYGNGLQFNGSTNGVSITGSPISRYNSDFTIAAWVQPGSLNQNGLVYYNQLGGIGLGIGGSTGGETTGARLRAIFEGYTWIIPTYDFTSTSTWYHIVMTKSGTTIRFYVNGTVLPETFNFTPLNNNYGAATYIGGSGRKFNGIVDEVAIYPVALSTVDISTLMSGGTPYQYYAGAGGSTYPGAAFFKLDESSGTASDSSAHNITGTLTAASFSAARTGNGVNFSSSTSLMTLSSPINLSGTSYTIATWAQFPLPAATGGYNTLVRGANDHAVLVRTSDKVIGVYDNVGGTAFHPGPVLNPSAGWHHIAAVGTNSMTKFYLDGALMSSTANFKSNDNIAVVGNYQGGTQNFGFIDDFAVYKAALSATEITNLMNQGLPSQGPLTLSACGTNYPNPTTCNYCGGTTNAYFGDSCSQAACPTNYPTTTSCPAGCYAANTQTYYPGNTCGATNCPGTYWATTSCPSGGCTTVAGSATGGSQATYVAANSCSNTACAMTDTSNTCPGTCANGQYYHAANTCSSTQCNQYYTPAYNNVTACRTATQYTSNGSQCGYINYGANCSTFCNAGSTGCYASSKLGIVHYGHGQYLTNNNVPEIYIVDTYSDGSTTGWWANASNLTQCGNSNVVMSQVESIFNAYSRLFNRYDYWGSGDSPTCAGDTGVFRNSCWGCEWIWDGLGWTRASDNHQ